MTAWENLSAEFERAKSAYYAAKERKAGPSETAYLEGKFNGLYIARELMAPYLQPRR